MKLKKVVRAIIGVLICLMGLYIGIRIGIVFGLVGGTIEIIRCINLTEFVLNFFRAIFVGGIGIAAGVMIYWFGGAFALDNFRDKKEDEERRKI